MIQIYTGSGKGKTTAALGLAFRALGHGKKVLLIQFIVSSLLLLDKQETCKKKKTGIYQKQ